MAVLRIGCALLLSLLLGLAPARAADPPPAAPPGLCDRPVLAVDPGMHTAPIIRADADAPGRWAVTGSLDKTVRVWSLADGALLRTIRLPTGPGNVGKVYAVAMSPDGALVAAGGWTRRTDADRQEQIYIFNRETGALVRRIEGLPEVVLHLAFSPDGRRLAAVLHGGKGLRVYAREQGWAEVARDGDYGDQSYGLAFAPDGRLATTEFNGRVRLYAGDLVGDVRPAAAVAAPGGARPFCIAFSPDGDRLAVGYHDSAAVTILDGRTLAPLLGPDLSGIEDGALSQVAWSPNGRTLFAAGHHALADARHVVLAWNVADAGARRKLLAGQNTVMSLVPLPGGDLLVAAADPWLARLRVDGGASWAHGPPQPDFRGQHHTLAVSGDGMRVDFGFQRAGKAPARFDVVSRALTRDPPPDGRTVRPRQEGLPVAGWFDEEHPTLDGRPLPLKPYEISHTLAVHPAGDRFVLGTEWSLRAFDGKGTPLWRRSVPSVAWAVNVTGDGRLVVAAYADGTIRWHRMADGAELLALMPLPDQADPDHPNWVAWTPEGFYAASEGARTVLRWHVNHGWDQPAESVPAADIPGSFRPNVLPLVLQELETPRALGLAELAQHNREVAVRTHSGVPPGARLHLLAIGVSAYNEDYAKNLRLHYADRDAQDLASAVKNTQGSLYSRVVPQVLANRDANKAGILRALNTMRMAMEAGGNNDLAVVHFSGHGALVGSELYLLPYEADARDSVGIEASGLSVSELRGRLLELAKHGRVLVLLDACHSGATTMDGAPLAVDSTALRAGLAAANVTVLTSSSGQQVSREDPKWAHGAFTKALIDALADPAADPDRKGLVSASGLTHYVATHVSALTDGAQTPGVEMRFDDTVFATGLRADAGQAR